MWSGDYQMLSQLYTRDNQVAELAWRDGKLYFCSHAVDDFGYRCDERPFEVATVEDAPQQETQILESAARNKFYVMSGERAFRSYTGGCTWEEI